jgi:hypothetical protein
MAAPKFAPVPPVEHVRAYSSPPVAPRTWSPTRPGDLAAGQPAGEQLGYQGPDQGFALTIAAHFHGRLHLRSDEHEHDVVRGCVGIALRRASMFSRAPVVHDLTIAFTIWGLLDQAAPAELVALRRSLFAGVGNPHHYREARGIADSVPESTLRMSPAEVSAAYPAHWRELLGR